MWNLGTGGREDVDLCFLVELCDDKDNKTCELCDCGMVEEEDAEAAVAVENDFDDLGRCFVLLVLVLALACGFDFDFDFDVDVIVVCVLALICLVRAFAAASALVSLGEGIGPW